MKGDVTMCGIAGAVGIKMDQITIDKMLATMRRRGPDSDGVFAHNNCCLLHSRLAIIDPLKGQQPMTTCWEGETYTIVYNGELYNTQEIRHILEKTGHRFSGHSDTEVVLHAYAQWSEDCVAKFNGIFAFAVWEHKRKKLFLARDRMGVKPLFYKMQDNTIMFASEIKTILAHPKVSAQLDAEGIAQIILLGPGRIPGSGVLKGICELEPGCYGYFACGRWNWKRYWKLKDRVHTDSFEETADKVRYLVTDAIERQMVSDVPIGTFLSGGLDSSIISSICSRKLNETGKTLSTFSVDYKDNDLHFKPGKFQPNADGDYIRLMQGYLSTDHNWSVLTPEELDAALDEANYARDLPGMADVDASLLVFCGQIRRKVKVALSGECADEIFGGYPWYRDSEIRALEGFPWSQNIKQRSAFIEEGVCSRIDPYDFVMDQYKQTLAMCDILPETPPNERRMKEMVNLNQRWFMQTLLDRKDRMSMYHGLEVRVPFCDHRIAEYLYGVPWEFKDRNGQEKGLLRYAMQDVLPQEVLRRKKSPYPKTHDPLYFRLVRDRLRGVIDRKDAPLHQIVNRKALEELLTADYVWPWYGQLMRVPQTIAYMLQINHWLTRYNVNIV